MPSPTGRGKADPTAAAEGRDHWLVGIVAPIAGTLLVLVSVSWAAQLHRKMGLLIYTEQALAVILGLALVIIYVKVPISGHARRLSVPWYDLLAAATAVYITIHLVLRYPVLAAESFYHPIETAVIGMFILPLVMEGLRRTAGTSLFVVLILFIAYGLFGHLIPGPLQGRSMPPTKLASYLTIDNIALFGLAMTIVGIVVVLFIFFGQLLLKSGGSAWFTELAACLMGRSRGGSAKIAVLASALFGSISGSAVSNVVSTGVITIPLMRKGGYDAKTAAAFEAVASTGGQIMPPIMGTAAFLMAEFLDVPYTTVILAALLPAILYYIAIFVAADMEAARLNIPPVPENQIPPIGRVISEGWHFTLPFVVLVMGMFTFNRSPAEAVLLAAITIVALSKVFGYKGTRLTLRNIYEAFRDTGVSAVDIVLIGAMAGLIIGINEVTGLSFGLGFVLVQFGEGNLFLLLILTALVCILLGMGMPTVAIYFLLATLAAPPLIKLGVNPLSAHLFVMYFGLMSMITPPVAIAAFAAANLAGARPMETAITSVRLGWTAYIMPFVFVLSPSLIMQGSVPTVITTAITAMAGVWIVSAAMMGYLLIELNMMTRVALFISGLLLLVPGATYGGGVIMDIGAVILAVILVGNEVRKWRLFKKTACCLDIQAATQPAPSSD